MASGTDMFIIVIRRVPEEENSLLKEVGQVNRPGF